MSRMAKSDPSEILEPRENTYFTGHDAAESAFLNAWSGGRLAHAWLICGPRGIGKATLAYRIARFVLSQEQNAEATSDMFGAPPALSLQMSAEHPVFRRIASQGHGDFRAIERGWSDAKQTKRKTVITVDDVRGIGSFMTMTPSEGGWRVVLIDATDEMNTNAANAVLKVLEEPPKQAILLLLAHNPDRLLPTIKSRCRRLDLRPLQTDQVAALLNRYRPDLSPEDTRPLAVLSDGSIGRALELEEEGGVDLFRDLIALLSTAPQIDTSLMHAVSDRALRGDVFWTITGLLSWWLARHTIEAARGGLTDLEEVIPGERKLAEKLIGLAPPIAWAETWQYLGRISERTLAVHLDRKRSLLLILNAIQQAALGRSAA